VTMFYELKFDGFSIWKKKKNFAGFMSLT